MRNLFLLILLGNILFALWQYTRPEMQGNEIRATDTGIDRLIMLNELASVEELVEVDAGQNESVIEAGIFSDEHGSASTTEVESQVVEASDQESGAVVTAVQKEPEGTQPQQVVSLEGGAEVTAALCSRLGPFSSSAKAELAGNILRLQALKVDLDIEEISEERYWVMLPEQPSFSEARRVEERLRQQGVRDLQVLSLAGRENAISLGVYRVKAIADARMRKLKQMGYTPQMDVIPRKRSRYWLNIVAENGNSLSDEVMQEISPIQEVLLEERQCN